MLAQMGSAAATGPQPWQTGFRPPASTTMQAIVDFNDIMFVIMVSIGAFVLGLLLYVVWRFSAKRNPTPSRTSHNTVIEILWTVIPVIILVVIAIPSFRVLYLADVVPESEFTIKATGLQWYWSYSFPDHGGFEFDAFLV